MIDALALTHIVKREKGAARRGTGGDALAVGAGFAAALRAT